MKVGPHAAHTDAMLRKYKTDVNFRESEINVSKNLTTVGNVDHVGSSECIDVIVDILNHNIIY